MTPKKRKSKFAYWETLGLEIVKADLAHGGHCLVGGNPETRKLAGEWVRMRETETKENADEVFLLKPQMYGVGIDLKAAGRKIARAITKMRRWLGRVAGGAPQA